jgi:hypothetical protein
MNKWLYLTITIGSVMFYLYTSIPTYTSGVDGTSYFPELIIPETLMAITILILLAIFHRKHYKQSNIFPFEIVKIAKQPLRIIFQLLLLGIILASANTEYPMYSISYLLVGYFITNTGIALVYYAQKTNEYNKALFHYFAVYPTAIIAFISLLLFSPMFIFGYAPHPS